MNFKKETKICSHQVHCAYELTLKRDTKKSQDHCAYNYVRQCATFYGQSQNRNENQNQKPTPRPKKFPARFPYNST